MKEYTIDFFTELPIAIYFGSFRQRKFHESACWAFIKWQRKDGNHKDSSIMKIISRFRRMASLFTIARTLQATWMSINREMDKEDVVDIYYGILLSHKKEWNWVICRNVDWFSVIKSKVSQKEKNKYHILIHICGI